MTELIWAILFVTLIFLLYLSIGWTALNQWIKYPIQELRRELALNGVGDSPGDPFFRALVSMAYWYVLVVWPVAVYRKIRKGRVIGR